MPSLTLNNIGKTYLGGFEAVTDFNIDIEPGEFIVLVGPSGCGKSTVLRMIAGLETISEGDMLMNGKRINDVAPADRDISMVFQNYALYGHMSVYQNIAFSQIIRHESADVIHEKVMGSADIVELKEQLNRYPKNLSGGQRQRVALGRSIVSSTDVILMDEPLSNLDAKLRGQARQELTKLHRKLGSTFVYVTHDQTEAMTMADRIVVMNNGRIQQIGTPAEVYHWPENMFVGGFVGSPPMSFINGRIQNDTFVSPGISFKMPQDILSKANNLADNEIAMGIRGENFVTEPNDGFAKVTANVLQSEFLGNHSLIYFEIDGYEFVAKLEQKFALLSEGDLLDLYIDIDRVHFFDPESENRIY